MRTSFTSIAALALFSLSACGGVIDDTPSEEGPAPLQLTPGSWAANEDQASFANEEGSVLATVRCDPETAEVTLETPGDFAPGARPAMMLRAGDFMHGIDPVDVQQGENGPVKIGRLPATGPLMNTIMTANVQITIESEGADPVMVEADDQLRGFIEGCTQQVANLGETEGS